MELFDTLKECVRVAQQADNVPLVRELINAQTQVLDLVDENQKLREQIKKMQETTDIAGKIERHEDRCRNISLPLLRNKCVLRQSSL